MSNDLRHSHEDNRHEAELRLGAIRRLEDHARERQLERLVGVLIQRPEDHHFHDAIVRERVSPRREMDVPDRPGHGEQRFGWGVIC